MGVREFEMFHGIVLTKLLRSDRPITLRMIETRPAEAWSAYTVNDELDLFIKHSTAHRTITRAKDARSWAFVFSANQLRQMAASCRDRQVYVALVGGGRDIKDDIMQVCLLEPHEWECLIDKSSTRPQTVTIRYVPGKSLRVFKGRKVKFKVPQNSLDNWDVPGS